MVLPDARVISPARWLLACLCALLLGGCTGDCSLRDGPMLPARTSWPTIAAYPGAEVLSPQLATPRRQTYWSFKTTAAITQVRAHYGVLLEPQGWSVDTSGVLTDTRSCPQLTLDIRESATTTGELFYTVELIESSSSRSCRPAC